MPKTITSPVARWPGSVTLQDPLLFPAYMKFRQCLEEADATEDGEAKRSMMLPGLCACVEKWDIAGLGQVTAGTFPASPISASAQLFAWIMDEVLSLLMEAEEVPKA